MKRKWLCEGLEQLSVEVGSMDFCYETASRTGVVGSEVRRFHYSLQAPQSISVAGPWSLQPTV